MQIENCFNKIFDIIVETGLQIAHDTKIDLELPLIPICIKAKGTITMHIPKEDSS